MVTNTTVKLRSTFETFRLPSFENQTVVAQLELVMEDVIQQADKLSLFNLASDARGEKIGRYLTELQIKTLHTRLSLLCYLDQNVPPEWETTGVIKINRNMRNAISRFKKETGLAQHENDNWVDQETWETLDELVSFEEPFDEKRWEGNFEETRRALIRAVGARLAVLGFLDSPTYDKKKIDKALHAFDQVVGILAPDDFPPTDGSRGGSAELQVIDKIFDQQALVKCLASSTIAFTVNPMLNKFSTCVANIELWLLGYPINLKDNYSLISETFFKHSYPSESKSEDTIVNAEDSPFYVLRDFWRDNGLRKRESLTNAELGITQEFFKVLSRVIEKGENLRFSTRQSERIYNQIVEETGSRFPDTFFGQVWENIKELGSRMWDGLKRVGIWINRQINYVKVKTARKATNMARLAFRFAVETFRKVKDAASRFIKSLKYAKPGSVDGTQYLHVSKSLDYILLISDQPGDIAQATTLGKEMLQASRDFGSGMRVLATILNILVETVKLITIPGADALVLILVLVKLISQSFVRSTLDSLSMPGR